MLVFNEKPIIIALVVILSIGLYPFVRNNPIFISIIMPIFISIFILVTIIFVIKSIIQYIKEDKKRKILEKYLTEKATECYENKYGEKLNINHIELNSFKDCLINVYTGSGVIFLDKEETKSIYIHSKYPNLSIDLIYDNIENCHILKDANFLINKELEEFDINFTVELNTNNIIYNQKCYKDNLKDYLIYNKIELKLDIMKEIKNKSEINNMSDYCERFSREISSILKNTLGNIYIEMAFLDNNSPKEFNAFDTYDFVGFISYYFKLDYVEVESEDCRYIYFNENPSVNLKNY